MVENISMVIPYVNNNDEVWQKMYIDYCNSVGLKNKLADMRCDRFEDIGLINYQLKLINKFMPFIKKIYLLLSNREQAPSNLPSNVEIIYHARFIPQRFLPTFNSATIEMFLWNLPIDSEYIIYANDDMLPMKPLKATDFFTEEGKCKIEWWKEDLRELRNTFRTQCFNSWQNISFILHKPTDKYKYMRPSHSMTPMIMSHNKLAYSLVKDIAEKHIRAFRTPYQFNQYIYPIFEYLVYGTCDSDIDFLYTQLKEDIDFNHQIVCLNIIPDSKKKEIIERLEKLCE